MPDMDVELLAAALRRDSADLDLYAKVLSVNLADSLPTGAVRVERRRTIADRMAGRDGAVTNLDGALGELRLATVARRGPEPARALVGELRGRAGQGLGPNVLGVREIAGRHRTVAVQETESRLVGERLGLHRAHPPDELADHEAQLGREG